MEASRYTWKEINDAGIAFLPIVGVREKMKITRMPSSLHPIGWYWSSSPDSENERNACSIYFDDVVNPKYDNSTYRGTGISIRLVRDVTE